MPETTTTNVSNDVTRIVELNETLTGAYSVTHADSGKTFYLNAANGAAITMPALKAGAFYKFVVAAAFDTADWVVTPSDAGKINGTIIVNGASVNKSAADTVTFELGAESLGDFVTFSCDGSNWFVSGTGNSAVSIS